MRAACALTILLSFAAPTLAQEDFVVELRDVGGGAPILKQSGPADLYIRPNETLTFYVLVYAMPGNRPIKNLELRIPGVVVYGQEHFHAGCCGYGTIQPSRSTTGPNGEGAPFTYHAGPGAGLSNIYVDFFYNGFDYTIPAVNAIRVGAEPAPFEWIGTGNFILVGDTSSHPYNHYGKGPFLDSLKQLALDYGGRWNRNLAYNDSSLEWGGIFDINANWSPPHSTHREGTNQDVRANGGPSSIPFDAAIRQWFVERVTQLFGQTPLHESVGTTNEHYHIRGGDLP